MSENTRLLLLSIALGLAVGISVWLFRWLFHWIHAELVVKIGVEGIGAWLFETFHLPPEFALILVLAGAGLLVGFIMQRYVGHEKYHGVAGIMESVALAGGRLPYRKIPFKALASAISLGAGASVGPEDPSVQIGAGLGSAFGHRLHQSEEQRRLLVAAGAASAISAAFNAPIAGVFFALEVILGEFNTRSFGVVVLSSVISSSFTVLVRGADGGPIFGELAFTLGTPLQLPFYVLLGIGLAFVSVLVIRVFYWQQTFWHQSINLPLPLEVALTGVVVGIVGLFLPQIMGPGEEVMADVLHGESQFGIIMLLILGFAKLIMTAISLGGGFMGGVFAPTLFIGIMLGSAYGQIVSRLGDASAVGNPAAYAIAGMAGMLAGVVRAPITAILLVFELTSDYQLILPIMLTSVICVAIIERILPGGIYHIALLRHGVHLKQGRDVDLMQGVTVAEAMVSPAPTIAKSASLSDLRHKLRQEHTSALCVVEAGNVLCGIVTMSDLQRAYEEAMSNEERAVESLTVADICTTDVVTTTPDDVLWTVIRTMGARDIGRLPVVKMKNGTPELVGILRRHNIMDAYNMAIMRKMHDQHVSEQIRLHALTGAHVLEIHINGDKPIVGHRLRDIHWPPEVIVASVLRKGKLIVPHGETQLHAGDVLTIVADIHAEDALAIIFGRDAIKS